MIVASERLREVSHCNIRPSSSSSTTNGTRRSLWAYWNLALICEMSLSSHTLEKTVAVELMDLLRVVHLLLRRCLPLGDVGLLVSQACLAGRLWQIHSSSSSRTSPAKVVLRECTCASKSPSLPRIVVVEWRCSHWITVKPHLLRFLKDPP